MKRTWGILFFCVAFLGIQGKYHYAQSYMDDKEFVIEAPSKFIYKRVSGQPRVGIGTSNPQSTLHVLGTLQSFDGIVFNELSQSINSGGSTTLDWSNNTRQRLIINNGSAFSKTLAFTPPVTGTSAAASLVTLVLEFTGTGMDEITWPASIVKWPEATAPNLTPNFASTIPGFTAAGKLDIVNFYWTRASGGDTNGTYYGVTTFAYTKN